MRQKITTALASGEYPDIAYIFGSDLANLARSDKVLDLTDAVNAPDFGWDDYYAPARDATMVDGRVRALPGARRRPRRGLQQAAVRRHGRRRAGRGLDVGRLRRHREGADRLQARARSAPRGRRSATRTPSGACGRSCGRAAARSSPTTARSASAARRARQAFGVVNQLAQDGSVYVDTKPDSDQTYQLFNNDKIGMVVTGPWQLPDFIEAEEGLRRRAAADVRRRAADDLGARHVDDLRQRRRPLEGGDRVRALAQLARAGRQVGHQGGLAADPQGHDRAAGVGRVPEGRARACRCSSTRSTARA